ncbi:MAG: hypothetical protein RIQ41_71 [Candidatus Parcubacteria bacterium]|jgi:hypothetical protein
MTLHEVEETLDTLIKRHTGLDESALVTLLRAGGWEEKDIREALVLFRLHVPQIEEALPTVEEERLLPANVPRDHLLAEGEPNLQPRVEATETREVESLRTSNETGAKEEFPHNLPLRPFETSEHVWPFSRYKDVFYGDDDVVEEKVPTPTPTPAVQAVERPAFHEVEAVSPHVTSEPPVEQDVYTREPQAPRELAVNESITRTYVPSKGDERLIILASSMLLFILLLLGYLYGNGRL